MKVVASFALLAVLMASPQLPTTKNPRSPCGESSPPFRNRTLQMVYDFKFLYTPYGNEYATSESIQAIVDDKVSSLAEKDRNRMQGRSSDPTFVVSMSLTRDGANQLTYSGALSESRQGEIRHITDISPKQAPGILSAPWFANIDQLTDDMAATIYKWFHEGWHDARPQCR